MTAPYESGILKRKPVFKKSRRIERSSTNPSMLWPSTPVELLWQVAGPTPRLVYSSPSQFSQEELPSSITSIGFHLLWRAIRRKAFTFNLTARRITKTKRPCSVLWRLRIFVSTWRCASIYRSQSSGLKNCVKSFCDPDPQSVICWASPPEVSISRVTLKNSSSMKWKGLS